MYQFSGPYTAVTAADHQLLSRRVNNGAHPRACQAADGTSSSSAATTNGNWSGTGNERISGTDYCSPVVMVMMMSLQRAARLQPRDVATWLELQAVLPVLHGLIAYPVFGHGSFVWSALLVVGVSTANFRCRDYRAIGISVTACLGRCVAGFTGVTATRP